MDETRAPGIKIAQIFLGKASFEHDPTMVNQPLGSNAGEHQLQVTATSAITTDMAHGIVTVLVQTTAESKGAYRFLVEIVGLFEKDGAEGNMELGEYLTGHAPPTMYPFVREAVANITGRGRFGPVWLKPLNFAAVEPQQSPAIVSP